MTLLLYEPEIKANVLRADESILAAKLLFREGHSDFAASRAYYAALNAAAPLSEAREYQQPSGVIAGIHQFFVKTGKIDKQHGKNLN